MQLLTKKAMIVSILFVALVAVFAAIGCGGGSGGTGRQTLPGEFGVGPITLPGTEPEPVDPPEPSPPPVVDPTPQDNLAAGWQAMNYGNYGAAINYFTRVINDPDATSEERRQAYNGRGWARVRYYSTTAGMSDFIQAGDLKESLLGYAMGLVQQGTRTSVSRAVDIFEQIGLDDPDYQLTIEHQAIGVTSADAHAMLAYSYFWRAEPGDADRAREQIQAARRDDSSQTSSVGQIYNTLKMAGLDGI